MLDIIIDTIVDSLRILPFLFIAFLIIEIIEHKLNDKARQTISESGRFGPFLGSLLGIIPQCGFGVLATNLYVTRIISLGTLIAVFLSTSDEMLPLLIANHISVKDIFIIIVIKFGVGVIFGYIIDLIYGKKDNVIYDICEDEHCGCENEHSLVRSSLIHTFKSLLYILIISFVINIIFEYVGSHYLSKLLLQDSFLAPFLISLIGLIPTCGASIMITELYLNGAINLGSAIAGLLTGSGVSILVLFKSNKNKKDNLRVLALVYGIGAICGLVIQIVSGFVH